MFVKSSFVGQGIIPYPFTGGGGIPFQHTDGRMLNRGQRVFCFIISYLVVAICNAKGRTESKKGFEFIFSKDGGGDAMAL